VNDKDPAGNQYREAIAIFAVLGAVLGVGVLVTLAAHLGYLVDGQPTGTVPISPIAILLSVATGRTWFPLAATIVLIAEILTLAAIVARVATWSRRRRPKRAWIDDRAKRLAHGRDLDPLSPQAVRAKAETLRVRMPDDRVPGLMIGRAVADRRELWADYETLHIDLWGPRQGKTTSRAIPAICEAPGPVLVTSNKRDIVDDTRGVREQVGTCWIFDPQAVAGGTPNWWWNPLATISNDVDAAALAAHFADGDDGLAVKKDAFFDPEGETLLANLFLAAALARRPITQVFRWVSDQGNLEPVRILEHLGEPLPAYELRAQYELDPKTRSGIFATARKMAGCLKRAPIQRWVTSDGPEDRRPEFRPSALATSSDTLYLLSMDGPGSCGPLVNALTATVVESAARVGSMSPMGRLRTPLVGVLDEAANVVRWRDLPARYSHFGSRGLILLTILQSWSQGIRCWGPEGMDALWSAAGVRIVGSGVDDSEFLRRRSELIGDHEHMRGTVNQQQRGAATRSYTLHEKRTLTAADLAAIPRGRALMWVAGMRPVLIETVPWMQRGHAANVAASHLKYSPSDPDSEAA
jgi:type IV secretory pathway TraG/TraD family ATPase VirD4